MLKKVAHVVGRVLLFWAATMAVLVLSSPVAGIAGNTVIVSGALTVPPTFALTLLFIKCSPRRFSPLAWRAMLGVAIMQALLGVLIATAPSTADMPNGSLKALLFSGFFTALWLASAICFRSASKRERGMVTARQAVRPVRSPPIAATRTEKLRRAT